MKKTTFIKYIALGLLLHLFYIAWPCTNLIITKGASVDGSTMMVYTNDGEWIYHLDQTQAQDHKPGDSLTFTSRYGISGKIDQIPHTFSMIGFQMNEYQVAIGETTFTGREELWNKSKYLEYWHLMILALARAKTAREAVEVITNIVDRYGYGSEGESFSIIDPDEAWILEMIGTGDGGEGAVWVAVKIPDGYISAHANMSRIGEFPLDDPENCIYSENVISFAVDKGYYNPDDNIAFRFNNVYNPPSPDRLKYCETRVWSLFRRCAPSMELSPDFHRGVEGAERYPLWIKPDKKISIQEVMFLIRDHFEGTQYDMTKGLDAGPFGNPNRWRPLFWENNEENYSWERPISTYNTAFSIIAQSRGWLPDEVGGITWFGVDDTYFTCYVPLYCGITEIPEPFTKGDLNKFSWESAWWAFNFVSNFANIKYNYMINDIHKLQQDLEAKFIKENDSVSDLVRSMNKDQMIETLTKYSVACGEQVHEKWIELGEYLITKYNDGYIQDEKGHPQEVGYPETWTNDMIKGQPDKFNIPDWNENGRIKELPY